jgi:hypothetical protein
LKLGINNPCQSKEIKKRGQVIQKATEFVPKVS